MFRSGSGFLLGMTLKRGAKGIGAVALLAIAMPIGLGAPRAAPESPITQREKTPGTHALFMANVGRFYARAPLPRQQRQRHAIVAALGAGLEAFAVELLREASEGSPRTDRDAIDQADVSRAIQLLIPHEIDRVGDLRFFPALSSDRQVPIEGYDCASFLSFGNHLTSLERASGQVSSGALRMDTLAEHALRDAIAKYGVLLLRLAGQLAVQDTVDVRLTTEDLARSAELIRERARSNAKEPPSTRRRTVSAAEQAQSSGASAMASTFFTDVTNQTGIRFTHRSSEWLGAFRLTTVDTPPTFSGGGIAAEDIDGDSDIDLLFVGGIGNAMWINDGNGEFRDMTERAGIDWLRPDGSRGEARTPIIADFDNDGRQDILIIYMNDDHRLFHNIDNEHFADVSSASGLGGKGLAGGPATTFDFDGDGLLDIYIGHIGDYLNGARPSFDGDSRNALPNQLFRNRGRMRFEDVTEGSGTADTGWAQAVSHVDFDGDGRQDIIVANDFGRNAFLQNRGGGRFEDVSGALGLHRIDHSMNVGITEYNDDGFPDVYISNLATLRKGGRYIFPDINLPSDFDRSVLADMTIEESDVLYVSLAEGGGLAAYRPADVVERGPTSAGWAWDAEFFDFDNDGDDDLCLLNGKSDFNTNPLVYRQPEADGRITYFLLNHNRESNVFFENESAVCKNRSSRSGADFEGNSRSAAYLDIDEDGDLDIAINNFHAPAVVLRNNAERNASNWLKLRLIGDPERGSSRDAIGARVRVTSGEHLRVSRLILGGSGYLSMNPKEQHFGLGRATSVQVQITWPNGEKTSLDSLAANHAYTVRQASGVVSARP